MPANGSSSDPASDPGDAMRHSAAIFLAQVLGLNDTTDQLAADLSSIKRDANAAVYTIQLDSSVGPAAFLVYAYLLNERGGEGHTGRELFETGLATLQQADQRSSPGPRAVAHAEAEPFAFILATTPGTYRALTGGAGGSQPQGVAPEPLYSDDVHELREEIATDLLGTLRQANKQAGDWLAAVGRWANDAGEDVSIQELDFTPGETELALYLLDDHSIGDLLQVLHTLVSTAQQRAAGSVRGEPGNGSSGS